MSKPRLKVAILVVSTTASTDPTTDTSSSGLLDIFETRGGGQWDVIDTKIVGDIVLDIQRSIAQWTDQESPMNLIVTTGGTGFAISDNTPEAISPLLHRHAPGIVHGMLAASLAVTPFALMSRPVAGVRNKTIILTLPGSPKGAKENLESVLKLLPHACILAAGADSRALHIGGVKKLEAEAGLSSKSTATQLNSHHSHAHSHSHTHSHGHGHAIPVQQTVPDANPRSNDPSQGPTRRHRESPYLMVSIDDALKLIKEHTPTPQVYSRKVDSTIVGSVLAEDVSADEDVPAYRASIVDGYAIVATEDGRGSKGVFPVASVSHAAPGGVPPLRSREISRITTGAPLPAGATSVVMVEDTVLRTLSEDGKEEKDVEILPDDIKPGENVREIGSDIKAGSIILQKGAEISAVGGEIGLLASVGKAEVSVYKKPVLGVLSTGDEIVSHDRAGGLRLGEVRDCNRPTILAAAQGLGFHVIDLGIARDQPGALEETLRAAFRKVDVVVTTGGVSMGELDLLKPTIERALGGTIHFGRVMMKPGKPSTFATIPLKDDAGVRISKLIFSLPGNPAAAITTFHLLVLPCLYYYSGILPAGLPKVIVTTSHEIPLDSNRPWYYSSVITVGKDGIFYASSTGSQLSSRVASLKSANALLCLPAQSGSLPTGTKMEALLIGRLHSAFDTA